MKDQREKEANPPQTQSAASLRKGAPPAPWMKAGEPPVHPPRPALRVAAAPAPEPGPRLYCSPPALIAWLRLPAPPARQSLCSDLHRGRGRVLFSTHGGGHDVKDAATPPRCSPFLLTGPATELSASVHPVRCAVGPPLQPPEHPTGSRGCPQLPRKVEGLGTLPLQALRSGLLQSRCWLRMPRSSTAVPPAWEHSADNDGKQTGEVGTGSSQASPTARDHLGVPFSSHLSLLGHAPTSP